MPTSGSSECKSGNYAIRHDGVIVKVGKDDKSRPTADRTEQKVYRDLVARGSDIPEWDGCHGAGAGDRLVPNEVFQDFATYSLEDWSEDRDRVSFQMLAYPACKVCRLVREMALLSTFFDRSVVAADSGRKRG